MSLIARHLEAHGTPTLCMASALDIIEAGRPPRAVFLDYPLGHTAGRPFDRDDQRAILGDALNAFEAIETPATIERLEYRWSDSDDWAQQDADASTGDSRAPRGMEPQYQTAADRTAAETTHASMRP
ncbi:MAG: hypothetical protein O7H40_03895 [Gammaproteobacteria bacterium]|nr:hypothetical protein [Gammaproteobacteria bacterium]